jgi:hypothetical protein
MSIGDFTLRSSDVTCPGFSHAHKPPGTNSSFEQAPKPSLFARSVEIRIPTAVNSYHIPERPFFYSLVANAVFVAAANICLIYRCEVSPGIQKLDEVDALLAFLAWSEFEG